MSEKLDPPHVASPASTGGAGSTFEEHVAAYWLAQLLTGSIPPILLETVVDEVSFQTNHLTWHTDDFLVVCGQTGTTQRRLAGQVKRNFTVSAKEPESRKAIEDFWKDFRRTDHFSPANDRLVLVTLRGTNILLEHFSGLLDCARAARDSEEFKTRVTSGLLNAKAVEHCDILREIVTEIEQEPCTEEKIWPFLRVLHLLPLDLFSSTGQTEAQIRSLLAHTANDGDRVQAAHDTWNELLVIANKARAEALSLRRADLPDRLRQRHSSVSTDDHRVLQRLKDHSSTVTTGIVSTIGPDLHLPRHKQIFKALEDLEQHQVLLISGSAGSGKSVIAKDVCAELAKTHFVFSFRAEEFAQPHLDNALAQANFGLSAAKLKALLASQDKKVIHVESVERLLEKPTRDAFTDLMGLIREDGSIRLVLTCRDYSVEQVRATFLRYAAIEHVLLHTPPLDDEELKHVEQVRPELGIPLRSASMRNILRNPFFLSKALSIPWSNDRPVPESEREFRMLFWSEVVRVDVAGALGLGRMREVSLQEVAVRRARALTTHVPCHDLDPASLASLGRDSLIISAAENPILVATSHDVVEDWAILQWLEEKHLTQANLTELSAVIGPHPAIRRSYRKWLGELAERDHTAADRLFAAAFSEAGISVQFRDDTLVSLLKSPEVSALLTRHEPQLLADNRALLKRIVHLILVSCVKASDSTTLGGFLTIPDGLVWPTILALIERHLNEFSREEYGILHGLVTAAVTNVGWWSPTVAGADSIVAIAYRILDSLKGYSDGEDRKRVLKVIAKLPHADPARFEATLRGHVEDGRRRDVVSDDLKELVFSGLDGVAVARELPDLLIEIGTEYLLASEAGLKDHDRYGSSLDLEPHFGIRPQLSHDFFPASALRGPWGQLLVRHREKALNFFTKVFNHSADWYAHPRIADRLEPAWQVTLTFADNTKKEQWVNPRLWGLYRGLSVGPYVLQSLLMALEQWLLDLAEQHPSKLDTVLVDILRRSDNAALSAVVASVAIAHPHSAGEALLVLLSVPDFIQIDRSRMAGEGSVSNTIDMLSPYGHGTRLYDEERKHSAQLPHRRRDLETAIMNLQLGALAPRVQAMLDGYKSIIREAESQDEENLIWQLALHRMDLRQYNAAIVQSPQPQESDGNEVRSMLQLDLKPAEPRVQDMVERSAVRFTSMGERIGLHMWARGVFERETGNHDPSLWLEKLNAAQAIERTDDEYDTGNQAPGFVAAVCIRDHWLELTPEQQTWCAHQVCAEVLRHANNWDITARRQRFSIMADRPSAQVLPVLIDKDLPSLQTEIPRAFVCALTHPVNEVRQWFSWGIGSDFWLKNRSIATRCINALATEHSTFSDAWNREQAKPHPERQPYSQVLVQCIEAVRSRFWDDEMVQTDAISKLDLTNDEDAEAHLGILTLLHGIPSDSLATGVLVKARTALVGWWNAEKDHRTSTQRNHELEFATEQHVAALLIRTSQEAAREFLSPMLDLVNTHSEQLSRFLDRITAAQDRNPNTPQYWFIWKMFAEAIQNSRWVPVLSDEHNYGQNPFSAIFLTDNWKQGVRHWRHLESYADHIHDLFNALPALSLTLDSYVRFLYHIGERELPRAFNFIAEALKRGNAEVMLKRVDTVAALEVLLQKHVYGRPLELKRDGTTRASVLLVLDNLVERGSSAAFRMRDDFVTPAA